MKTVALVLLAALICWGGYVASSKAKTAFAAVRAERSQAVAQIFE